MHQIRQRMLYTSLFSILFPALLFSTSWQQGIKSSEAEQVIVAEGVGKDEKQARKAAFRDAVSRVVGSLVDAQTLVKNDEVISERILEYSGGFIKTYDTLKTDKNSDGLVRVKIKATVERLQIISKLRDASITIKEVKGADLAAEKMTKDEARKNAAEMLVNLYSDLPNLMKAEVIGKPSMNAANEAVVVEIAVSVDRKKYDAFAKRAANMLDKLASSKGTQLISGEQKKIGTTNMISYPGLGFGTSFGYQKHSHTIWLTTNMDGTHSRMRWNWYSLNLDSSNIINCLDGRFVLCATFKDKEGNVVAESENDLFRTYGSNSQFIKTRNTIWPPDCAALFYLLSHTKTLDSSKITFTNVIVSPAILYYNYKGDDMHVWAHRITHPIKLIVKMTDEDLAKVTSIETSVKLNRHSQAK